MNEKSLRGRKCSWDKELARKCWEQGLQDKDIAKVCGISASTIGDWRRAECLTANTAKTAAAGKPAMDHDPRQCIGCIYWRRLGNSGGATIMCCHYLIDNGHSRKRKGKKCLSKKMKG